MNDMRKVLRYYDSMTNTTQNLSIEKTATPMQVFKVFGTRPDMFTGLYFYGYQYKAGLNTADIRSTPTGITGLHCFKTLQAAKDFFTLHKDTRAALKHYASLFSVIIPKGTEILRYVPENHNWIITSQLEFAPELHTLFLADKLPENYNPTHPIVQEINSIF